MKKNEFENRLQNDLFPEMPASFSRKLTVAMETEGVRVRKRPTAAGIFAWIVSVSAAAAVLLIVLVGVRRNIPSGRDVFVQDAAEFVRGPPDLGQPPSQDAGQFRKPFGADDHQGHHQDQ